MRSGQYDVVKLIRSEDPGYPVYSLLGGLRKIQVCFFINSREVEIEINIAGAANLCQILF